MRGGSTGNVILVKFLVLYLVIAIIIAIAAVLVDILRPWIMKRSQKFRKTAFFAALDVFFVVTAIAARKCFGGWLCGVLLSIIFTGILAIFTQTAYESGKRGTYSSLPERTTRGEEEKPTKSEIVLGFLCAMIPTAALGAAYFRGYSTGNCVLSVMFGFFVAVCVLASGLWLMAKGKTGLTSSSVKGERKMQTLVAGFISSVNLFLKQAAAFFDPRCSKRGCESLNVAPTGKYEVITIPLAASGDTHFSPASMRQIREFECRDCGNIFWHWN